MPPLRSLVFRSILAGSAVLAMTGLFYRYSIVPRQQEQTELARKTEELRTRLRAAQEEMFQIKEQEQTLTGIRYRLNAMYDDTPSGPAVTWIPVRVKARLSRFGVERANIRLNSMQREPRLPGFERGFWHVSLPPESGLRKMTDALLAVAQIEQDRFIKILELNLRSETEEPGWTTGHVNVMSFVRK